MSRRESTKWSITIGAFVAFFMFGFVDNFKGPVIPTILEDLQFTYSQGSAILFSAYLGFLTAILLAGYLSETQGEKAILVFAGIIIALGAFSYGAMSLPIMLYISSMGIGLGIGSIEVGANKIIVHFHHQDKGKFLNLLAFFHGVGAMLAPLYAGKLISSGLSWRSVYFIGGGIVLIMPVYFLMLKIPFARTDDYKKETLKQRIAALGEKRLVLIALLLLFYVAAEISIASWMVDFLQKEKGLSIETGSLFLALYFAFMTGGRLLGSFFVTRIGYFRAMIIAVVLSILTLSSGIFLNNSLAILISITGFFYSIVFPTATAMAVEKTKASSGLVYSLLFFFAGIGGVLGPWFSGNIANAFTIFAGFSMAIIYAGVMLIILLCLGIQGEVGVGGRQRAAKEIASNSETHPNQAST